MNVPDAVLRTRDIWVVDLIRGLRTRFTFDAADQMQSVWSPDGSRLVFNSQRKGVFDLYQKASSGAGAEELLFADDGDKFPESWSADGRFMLYVRGLQSPPFDLWALPLFGDRKPFPVVQTRFVQGGGAFSPDGHGGWRVKWRLDGKEVFYIGPGDLLMAASVHTTADRVEIGAVQSLFRLPRRPLTRNFFDVSADGQRFLVNSIGEPGAPAQITLVINWPALLKK